tara:strand:+ start:103 stop:237 length:135 start_codon:yes stop_codon:yes gene_type:complete
MKVTIPEVMEKSIKIIVEKTDFFKDEEDFVQQALVKQIAKFRDL